MYINPENVNLENVNLENDKIYLPSKKHLMSSKIAMETRSLIDFRRSSFTKSKQSIRDIGVAYVVICTVQSAL